MSTTRETFLCLGPSQWPVLRNGLVIRVAKFANNELRAGDLVVFSKSGSRICHRLLKVNRNGDESLWLTKGDANLNVDGWISEGQILGKVVEVNGRPVTHPFFAIPSHLFFWHSLLQHTLYQMIFFSSFGRKLGLLRMKILPRPIFMKMYAKLSAPWIHLLNKTPSQRS